MKNSLRVIGLTGGIASGKSTVAAFLRKSGAPVMDADELGHMALEKGTDTHRQVVETFGRDILDDEGRINRQRLGAKVFDNKEKRALLEGITHPAIATLAKKGLMLIAERGESFAFYEAALLVETGIYRNLAGLVVVSCPLETQLRRLIARDGLTNEAAAARIASQFPLQEKLDVADYIINTDGTLEETEARTLEVLSSIKASLPNS
jgi:dephospho-CoA kinase